MLSTITGVLRHRPASKRSSRSEIRRFMCRHSGISYDFLSYESSLAIFACRKYFMPTQATTTHTHAMTAVQTINAG